ncbi:MAG: hypothetical protein J6I50_07245 [Clostridia bacterium]|nr:hypothetical protein [Clostridia bacterium]
MAHVNATARSSINRSMDMIQKDLFAGSPEKGFANRFFSSYVTVLDHHTEGGSL